MNNEARTGYAKTRNGHHIGMPDMTTKRCTHVVVRENNDGREAKIANRCGVDLLLILQRVYAQARVLRAGKEQRPVGRKGDGSDNVTVHAER